MKRTSLFVLVLLAGLIVTTGCDQVKSLLGPKKTRPRPTVAGVPDLQILGVTEEEQVALKDRLLVRGLLQQAADYVVIINTQLVRKGESMRMRVNRTTYDVKVLSVTEMRVVLEASKLTDDDM